MILTKPIGKLVARNIKEQLQHIKKILVKGTIVLIPRIGKKSK